MVEMFLATAAPCASEAALVNKSQGAAGAAKEKAMGALSSVGAKTLFGFLAGAMALAALATKAPGAWGAAACWGLACAAAALWSKARGFEGKMQNESLAAQEAFARGSSYEREAGSVKTGAALALLSMVCALLSALSVLGCFVASPLWGVVAGAPLAWTVARAIKAQEEESGHVGS
jgi:hypothetical protein